MKVVILAGGKGSRISYYTQKIPKPMVKIGGKPILSHIMSLFKYYGFDDFIIAAGYKKSVIDKYYKNSKNFRTLIQKRLQVLIGFLKRSIRVKAARV